MDQIIEELLDVQQQLRAELTKLPLWKTLQRIDHLLDLRYRQLAQTAQTRSVRHLPPGRLLCEMVQEAKALDIWENEGGRLSPGA